MTKADTVRLLLIERCNSAEIAAAVGWDECSVRRFLRQGLATKSRIARSFNGWRGCRIGPRVVSL